MTPTTAADRAGRAAMAAALALARRAEGTTAPNPPVGCVILDADGAVAGRGRTGRGGRPHAEAEALSRAGGRARGGAAFVTLEPCAHEGETPSCARALAEAGIARVVFAARDPDPRTCGEGARILREAGVEVEEGRLSGEAWPLNAGHALRIREGRPFVTLKVASSLDGRIATEAGESRWITGEAARRHAHLLRARSDAVLVGAATARADDPLLTCRLPGLEGDSPVRAVLAGSAGIDPKGALARSAGEVPLWVLAPPGAGGEGLQGVEEAGGELVQVPAGDDGRASLPDALRLLATRGVGSLLVEGGGRLAAGLVAAGLVDRIAWYQAGAVLGGGGVPAVDALPPLPLARRPRFRREGTRALGPDVLSLLAREAPAAAGGVRGREPPRPL